MSFFCRARDWRCNIVHDKFMVPPKTAVHVWSLAAKSLTNSRQDIEGVVWVRDGDEEDDYITGCILIAILILRSCQRFFAT